MIAVPSLSTLSGQHEVARLSRLRAFFSEHPKGLAFTVLPRSCSWIFAATHRKQRGAIYIIAQPENRCLMDLRGMILPLAGECLTGQKV